MKNAGFTLFEVLATIIIVVVGMVSVVSVFSTSTMLDVDIENKSKALLLAQEKMEEIKAADSYTGVDDFAASRAALSGDFSSFDREVIVSGDPKQVDVIVYWNVKGDEQQVALTTLFADYDY